MHAGLETDAVFDLTPEQLIEANQEINGASLGDVHGLEEFPEHGTGGTGLEEGSEFLFERGVVIERIFFSVGFEEEVERVIDRHFGDEVHLDEQLARFFGNDEAAEVVAERILLPVQEMFSGQDAKRITEDGGAAMRGGPQADDVGRVRDRAVILVMCPVVESYVYRHELPALFSPRPPIHSWTWVRSLPGRRLSGMRRAKNAS